MSNSGELRQALCLTVQGVVQGVGFRPFVQRLATRFGLTGWVRNDESGVRIHLEGTPADLDSYCTAFPNEVPPAAHLDHWEVAAGQTTQTDDFRILTSDSRHAPLVRVPPDLAVCHVCLDDVMTNGNRRHEYALTTCTDCGPRYSLLRELPFDRPRTAMAAFALCQPCVTEYEHVHDRRFHAQTMACADCGPQVVLWDGQGESQAHGTQAVAAAARLLLEGRILALKGVGGFQLLARADSSEAVTRLRHCKGRPGKPFAVMVPDVATAELLCWVSREEKQALTSSCNPIVLLERRPALPLAPEVAPQVKTLGLFLPTTPLHHLLMRQVQVPVVATSGNVSEEPIAIAEQEAFTRLQGIAEAFLVHDREIVHRVDDSVVRVIDHQPVVFRLARGYAPLPLPTLEGWKDLPPVLAVGGQQKVALAAWTGQQAVLGPHLGDMDHPASRTAFVDTVHRLETLYRFKPRALACDLHPDYFTTRWAAEQGLPVIPVQHHHAHAAAVMAEHDLLEEETLAFTWDGTGHGSDGTVWGGEVLRATVPDFRRVASLRPFPLLGGDAAIRHPQRLALAVFAESFGSEQTLADAKLLQRLGVSSQEARTLLHLADKPHLSPRTTSMGRLFDAVAALVLGIREVTYEGEAALQWEAVVEPEETAGYPILGSEGPGDWRPLLQAVLYDLRHDVAPGRIAGRFHQGLADWATAVSERFPGLPITLGGGCFQNKVLRERTLAALRARGRQVFAATKIPPGDGGLAAGQLAVALARMQRKG